MSEIAERVTVTAEESVLYTRGIASKVFGASGETSEHVALIDCDETDALSVHTLAETMDGLTIVWESSSGSYHLWDLTPRPFEATIMDVLDIRAADAEHVAQSRRRRAWVVRVAGKVFEDGETYKDAPRLLAAYDDGESAVSRGHLAIAEDRGAEVEIAEDRLVGENRVETHSYMTITDAAKEDLR